MGSNIFAKRNFTAVRKLNASGTAEKVVRHDGPEPNPVMMVLTQDVENRIVDDKRRNPRHDFKAEKVFKKGTRFVVNSEEFERDGKVVHRLFLESFDNAGKAAEGSPLWDLLMPHMVKAPETLTSVLAEMRCASHSCQRLLQNLVDMGRITLMDVRKAEKFTKRV